MPFIISETLTETQYCGVDSTLEFARKFYFPMARGEVLSPELMALVPDPLFAVPKDPNFVPDAFLAAGVWVVESSVRRVIEYFEPHLHQFISVNLRVRGSEKDWGQYHLLRVGQVIDAIVIEDTRFAEGLGQTGFAKSKTIDMLIGPTVLRSKPIEGRHLWRGGIGRLGGGGDPFSYYLFCSDELAEKCKQAAITGWRFWACELQSDQ